MSDGMNVPRTTVGDVERILGHKLPPASMIPQLLKKKFFRINQYGQRDVIELDKKGGYFSKHMEALTDENLVDKDAIAAELAWRDCEIDRLWNMYRKECPSNAGAGGGV